MTGDASHFNVATQSAIESNILDIVRFVEGQAFQNVLSEMWSMPPERRAEYVVTVLLDADALSARGVIAPSDLVIQRSSFRDNRPTLFCITKHLPPGLLWDKVTITFDNPDGEPALRYEDVTAAIPRY